MTTIPHPLRVAFAGTPEFAVPTLEALLEAGHAVVAVYSQPDRPAGRGRQLRPSPVKQCALGHGLEVCQPPTLRDATAQQALAALDLDVMVVVAYGLLLPPPVLAAPRLGCINVHASLLPRWRGAAPIQRALLAGDTRTGVTIMQMEQGLDTGPMLAREILPIAADDTAATLHDRLAGLGARLLCATLPALARGEVAAEAQDAAAATYAAKLTKAEARLDWHANAAALDRQVRALLPWPVAETHLDGQPLRIWQAAPRAGAAGSPGRIVAAGPEGIDVACGAGLLRLQRVQLAGKRPVAAGDFANGRPLLGLTLG
jgi:methionyl-tRNA formyltransferase